MQPISLFDALHGKKVLSVDPSLRSMEPGL
jgi:hypothetical protein